MAILDITTQNNTLVVDSRLIAEDLGIEHDSLLKTIKKYVDRLSRKSPVRFEIDVVKRPQGGTYEVSYCFLNESQATLLMTFSRNTDRVLDCKENLVDAFTAAKNRSLQTATVSTPGSYKEALKALVAEIEAKEQLEAENALLEQENHQLSEALDELFDYSSIIRIAKFNLVSESNFSWHRLKAVSIQMNLEIKKVPCPRFVTKNLYSHDVWRVAYPTMRLPETTTLVIKR
jgi:phage regulator Rha-like protein